MQFDIYRDQALERLLIVKRGTNIKQLEDLQPRFLNGLERPNQVDSEVGSLPLGLNSEEVIEAVERHGYFASTHEASIKEVDG
ncbi:hypothetical protein N5D79_08605 [Pseudomonas sp. GD03817]|uniref:hypothetical protein n=1 Tax=unclassified Pseudomonas TaxID=196821 RepID=UPI0024469CA3|nr:MULTISPECIES: hypothetical protein [unclassified Pseudomonas]MDH1401273.1 hypothetical protein [Pseudomonas sp. GD03730]MDH1774937.1 hypothetical protein [Pseudomonas sp. GD03817]